MDLPNPCPWFKLDGTPSLEPRLETFPPELLAELAAVRGELEALLPRICGCEHERVIALRYPTPESFDRKVRAETDSQVFGRVLCPDVGVNPMCAHRSSILLPDTLGSPIKRLREAGILERSEWEPWDTQTSDKLREIDNRVAERRWEETPDAVEEAKLAQAPILTDMQEKITTLLAIIERLIGPPPDRRTSLPVVS